MPSVGYNSTPVLRSQRQIGDAKAVALLHPGYACESWSRRAPVLRYNGQTSEIREIFMPRLRPDNAGKPSSTEPKRGRAGRLRIADTADTRQVILGAAEEVLIAVGYASFTTRKVAHAAGIAIGNLTYHFPNKTDLTEALIDYVLERYLKHIRAPRIADSGNGNGNHPLSELVRWTMTDAVNPHIVRLCRELWAMACHQKIAARAMDELYRRIMQAAVDVVRAANPQLTPEEALHLTYFLALLSEGTVVLFGTNPAAEQLLPGVIDLAVEAAEYLVGFQSVRGSAPVSKPPATRPRSNTRK
jgi:AcrR family transcriptional regulator